VEQRVTEVTQVGGVGTPGTGVHRGSSSGCASLHTDARGQARSDAMDVVSIRARASH
jgi:hypothetical protein